MRSALTYGLAVVSLISSALIFPVSAEHAHHHGDFVGRVVHTRQARSGSSSILNDTQMPDDHVSSSPAAMMVADCIDRHCDIQTINPDAVALEAPRSLIHEVHIQTLQLNLSEPTATSARRRSHTRSSKVAEQDSAELSAASTGCAEDSRLSFDPANDPVLDDSTPEVTANESEDGSKPHLDLRSAKIPRHLLKPRQDNGYQSFVLGDSPKPSSTISAAAAGTSDLCPQGNGTTFKTRGGISYQVVCNIDFPGNDYRFQKAGSLEECVLRCDTFNWISHGPYCLAAIFVPSRVEYDDDCYLKSSVDDPTYTTFEIHGLVRLSAIKAVTSSAAEASSSKITSRSEVPSDASSSSDAATSKTPQTSADGPAPSTSPTGNQPGITYAVGDEVIEPKVAGSHLHGPTKNEPTKQYIEAENPEPITLASKLLKKVVNGDLTTDYDIAPQTGVLSINITTQSMLSALDGTPRMSRDGGSGGFLNGQHLFIFCDTGSYSAPAAGEDGKFVGFVSSSVAVDTGMHGLDNEPIVLKDGIGQWYGKNGRQRGFAPLTEGELSYNLKMQGGGQRYAIWPEAPILPLDATRGIIFAPIVYDNVDKKTNVAHFTYTGATLLTITADNKAGPIAERTAVKVFEQDEIEWGCSGGIRSWGASGVGSDDGKVYVFGNTHGGILLARTTPQEVANRDSYEYWHGNSWSEKMLTDKDTDSLFIEGVFMDVNLFYSPRHLTFILVYLTTYADNTFYYRYLKADNGILPHYAPGGDAATDYVENILKYEWSEQRTLYEVPKSKSGRYIYAGAVHAGYFGSNDITNGGSRILLSWTAPTGENPASADSEYQIITAGIDWE